MKYGIALPNSGPFASLDAIKRMAVAAERLGYDLVSVHDHVNWSMVDRHHFYAGSIEAADSVERPTDFYDAMSVLAYLAGATSKLRLMPAAICLAWRPVLLLARQALTLHQLSEGRFMLNVCVGNLHKDFEVMGAPWEERGPTSVEKLKVLRMLIDQAGPFSFDGKYVQFKDAELAPQPKGLPLGYSATSDISLKRAARYCEGWFPTGGPSYFAQKIPELYREAERAGRGKVVFETGTLVHSYIARTDEAAMKAGRATLAAHAGSEWMQRHDSSGWAQAHFIGSPEIVAARLREYKASGVTMLRLGLAGMSVGEMIEQMDIFMTEVVPLAT